MLLRVGDYDAWQYRVYLDGVPVDCVYADDAAGEVVLLTDEFDHDAGDFRTETRRGQVEIRRDHVI